MNGWEYKTVQFRQGAIFTEQLNELGSKGWNLKVMIDTDYGPVFIFNRPMPIGEPWAESIPSGYPMTTNIPVDVS